MILLVRERKLGRLENCCCFSERAVFLQLDGEHLWREQSGLHSIFTQTPQICSRASWCIYTISSNLLMSIPSSGVKSVAAVGIKSDAGRLSWRPQCHSSLRTAGAQEPTSHVASGSSGQCRQLCTLTSHITLQDSRGSWRTLIQGTFRPPHLLQSSTASAPVCQVTMSCYSASRQGEV